MLEWFPSHRQRQREAQERQRQFEAQQRQFEAQEREKERQFELRWLEMQRTQAPPVAAHRESGPSFKVENAVRLIPRFQDQDIETFLISFEKIAALNNFPRDKYSAVLQAHLTGKALRVFTEMSSPEHVDSDLLIHVQHPKY